MPISFIQQKKRQKQLFLVVGGVIVVTFLVLWFGYFNKKREVSILLPSAATTSFVKDIKVNFEILKDPFLKEFNVFEKISPFEGDAGRKNPFLPY